MQHAREKHPPDDRACARSMPSAIAEVRANLAKFGGVLLTVDEIKEKEREERREKRGSRRKGERREALGPTSDPHAVYLHRCDETGGVLLTFDEIKEKEREERRDYYYFIFASQHDPLASLSRETGTPHSAGDAQCGGCDPMRVLLYLCIATRPPSLSLA